MQHAKHSGWKTTEYCKHASCHCGVETQRQGAVSLACLSMSRTKTTGRLEAKHRTWLVMTISLCPCSLIWDAIHQSRILELGGDQADYALKAQ